MAPTIPDRWRELNSTQRDILVTLVLDGPANNITIHRLRGASSKGQASTQRGLKALREQGYVTRELNDDDQREWLNSLTDDGREVVRAGVIEPADAIAEVVA